MTDNDLKKLNRAELLELLVEQSKKIDQLQAQLDEANRKLADRQIEIDKAGSIAEASLRLSGVFQAAEEAAEQYLENIRRLSDRQETLCRQLEEESRKAAEQRMAETEETCSRMETETRKKCQELLSSAEDGARQYWTVAQQRLDEYCAAREELRFLMAARNGKDPLA